MQNSHLNFTPIRYENTFRNFIKGLYANISMLKDVWEDFSKTKLAIKVAF